jgi:hypothetical protein
MKYNVSIIRPSQLPITFRFWCIVTSRGLLAWQVNLSFYWISKFERNQRVVHFPVVEHSRRQLYFLWVGNMSIVCFFLVRFVVVYVKLGATQASCPTNAQLCISFTILNSDLAIYDMPMPNKRVIWFALRQYHKFHLRKNLDFVVVLWLWVVWILICSLCGLSLWHMM